MPTKIKVTWPHYWSRLQDAVVSRKHSPPAVLNGREPHSLRHNSSTQTHPCWARGQESFSHMNSWQCLENQFWTLSRVTHSHMQHTTGESLCQTHSHLGKQYSFSEGWSLGSVCRRQDITQKVHRTSHMTRSMCYVYNLVLWRRKPHAKAC